VVLPPPGLTLPEKERTDVRPAMQKDGVCDPPPGLYKLMNLSAAWQGRSVTCETDCSSTSVSTSVPISPGTSSFTEETIAVMAAEDVVDSVFGYVSGCILQESVALSQRSVQTLRLEEAVEQTPTRTPNCLSVGSAGHQLGLCQPCDFFQRGRCTKASECTFCHLCGPGESRRRKRQNRKLGKIATRSLGANVNMAACGVMWA